MTSLMLKNFTRIAGIKSYDRLLVTADRWLIFETVALVTISCSMDFNGFPFDSHICKFQVTADLPESEVYLHSSFHWKSNPPQGYAWGRASLTNSLEFQVEFGDLPDTHRIMQQHYQATNVTYLRESIAGFQIQIKRKVTQYLFHYYIPTGLFVVVSCASYVIPPDSVPARITLIITTFLVLINLANAAFTKFPISTNINPIQIWILICISFVFVSIVEYAFILLYQRIIIKKTMVTRRNIDRQGLCQRPMKADMVGITENSMKILLAQIDFACMTISLLIFLIYNIVYWTVGLDSQINKK